MSLADSLIRSMVASEVNDAADVSLVAGLVHDDFAAAEGDDLAAIERAIAAARVKFPPLFRAPAPAKPQHDMATAAGRQAAGLAAKLAAIEAGPNPYSATSLNRTAQAVLEKNSPEMARKMKAAGGR